MNADKLTVVTVRESVLMDNELAAAQNHAQFTKANVLAINLMAAPGAGKTSLIARTVEALQGLARVGVIEGDIAGNIDTERVVAAGATGAIQINTGGNCHLDAGMIKHALEPLQLDHIDILFIENVGNLVCPAHWTLGEHLKVALLGAAEGDDKPLKYPQLFTIADAVVLNKIDLVEYVDFDRTRFYESLHALNASVPIFELSCRDGTGIDEWTRWLLAQRSAIDRA